MITGVHETWVGVVFLFVCFQSIYLFIYFTYSKTPVKEAKYIPFRSLVGMVEVKAEQELCDPEQCSQSSSFIQPILTVASASFWSPAVVDKLPNEPCLWRLKELLVLKVILGKVPTAVTLSKYFLNYVKPEPHDSLILLRLPAKALPAMVVQRNSSLGIPGTQ